MERLLKALSKKAPPLYDELLVRQKLIASDPNEGYQLSGDLAAYMSYDFTFKGISVRICYAVFKEDSHVKFVYCGTRENFYKELKNYLFG